MDTGQLDGQLDLFAEIEQAEAAAAKAAEDAIPVVCLYRSTARGLDARMAELRATEKHRHAWSLAMCCPTERTQRCQITVLSAHTWVDRRYGESVWPCGCDGELGYRGVCLGLGCDWEGPPRESEQLAVFDAADHAWPGWRDLPYVPSAPYDKKREPAWLAKILAAYPAGWLEAGGPIKTSRNSKIATRPHGPATPFGGYDIGIYEPDQEDK